MGIYKDDIEWANKFHPMKHNDIVTLENTTVGNLVSGFEDKKYTLSEMFDILNINNAESVAFDELGLLHCYAFDWNDYNITIYCYNENGPSYGCSVEADDFVKIASHKIKKLTLSDTEVIMKVLPKLMKKPVRFMQNVRVAQKSK